MESYNFPCSKNSPFPNVFLHKGQPSPALCPSTLPSTRPGRCVNFFHSHSTGFKDGRKGELFPPLVALSSPTATGRFVLLAADETMDGARSGNRGSAGGFSIWNPKPLGGRARWNYGLSTETKLPFQPVVQTRI